MNVDVIMGGPEDEQESLAPEKQDPDEFFAKSAFRIVYQTNNFFLPQIRDLIDKGEVLNYENVQSDEVGGRAVDTVGYRNCRVRGPTEGQAGTIAKG